MRIHVAYRTGKPWDPFPTTPEDVTKPSAGKGMMAHRIWVEGREVVGGVNSLSIRQAAGADFAMVAMIVRVPVGELTEEAVEFAEDAAGPPRAEHGLRLREWHTEDDVVTIRLTHPPDDAGKVRLSNAITAFVQQLQRLGL